MLAVRWYLRYGLSYRDLEELLAERGIEVDHVTLYRWVQRFTPLLIDAARPCRHAVGDRWFVDETYVKVAGVWRYVYRAVDQHGQVIDVYVSKPRDTAAATWFFTPSARHAHGDPVEVDHRQAAHVCPSGHRRAGARRRGTTPTSTRTTGSKPTTAGSRPGSDRCAASKPTGPPSVIIAATPSCRTCDAATTNSASTPSPALRVAAAFDELAQAI